MREAERSGNMTWVKGEISDEAAREEIAKLKKELQQKNGELAQ